MIDTEPKHIPLRDIPWLPGERKPDFPTAETSTFNDPDSQIAISLIIAFTNPRSNSSSRRQVMGGITQFCTSVERYNFLCQTIQDQIEVAQERRLPESQAREASFREMLARIEEKIGPYQYFRLRARFQEHLAPSVGFKNRYGEILRGDLRATFVKGERNVFFQENALPDKECDILFAKSLERYGSFKRAHAAVSAFQSLGRRTFPTEGLVGQIYIELNRHHEEILRRKNTEEEAIQIYGWMVLDELDQLLEEGYEFECMAERGLTDIKQDFRPASELTLEEYRREVKLLAAQDKRRDTAVVEQLKDLAEEVEREKRKTNVYLLFGDAHQVMAKKMPPKLRLSSTCLVTDLSYYPESFSQLMVMLHEGKEPPEELWKENYECFRSLPQN